MLPHGRTWNCRIEGQGRRDGGAVVAEQRWDREVAGVLDGGSRRGELDAVRGVCVAWVETAPRSPTGRIIIPTHRHGV